MKHRLIMMFGKGQPILRNKNELSYRKTSYILPGKTERAVNTPMMVEAILKLFKDEQFQQLHILGTKDSMWSTLYGYCLGDHLDDESLDFFEKLDNKIREGKIPNEEEMNRVRETTEEYLGISTQCSIIPVGKSEKEMWKLFEDIVDLPDDGDKISIDITHGVRYQPFILLMAMAYFRTIRKRVKWGKVFYGAYELSNDYFEGFSPIFDLTSIFNMFDWLIAANAFKEYGDWGPINQLLKTTFDTEEAKRFMEEGSNLSQAIQLYEIEKVHSLAGRFLATLNNLDAKNGKDSPPFRLIQKTLQAFPRKLRETNSESELMLVLAQQHLKNEGQFGLAILAIWEAIIARFSDIFQVDSTRIENYLELSRIVRGKKKWPRDMLAPRLRNFPIKVQRINEMRNSIAHTHSKNLEREQPIETEVWELFAYFNVSLLDEHLDLLYSFIKFEPEEL